MNAWHFDFIPQSRHAWAVDETLTGSRLEIPTREKRFAPVLTVVHHPDRRHLGARLVLAARRTVEIGRGGTAFGPGVLDDRRLSRKHVEVRRTGETEAKVVVADAGSRNGTLVNGDPVRSSIPLEPGDVLAAGELLLLFHHGPLLHRPPRHQRLLGVSAPMAAVVEQLGQVAARDTTVLLLGETGVGKEVVAKAIHDQSGRSGRFVAINCGSLTDTLLQSELFGHVRGAFSGAQSNRRGLVDDAAGGTLFLDEIGDASPTLQVSLLRLLQEREYRAVGGNQTMTSDARIIAATHRDLTTSEAQGGFRQDLRMRLSRWVIPIPPLRDRREDIPVLAAAFAEQYTGRRIELSRTLVYTLLRYDWPGNVRELDAIIERATVTLPGSAPVMEPPDWLVDTLQMTPTRASPGERPSAPAGERKAPPNRAPRERPSLDGLVEALKAAGGNVKLMAEQLGIARKTAYRWLDDAGVDVDAVRGTLEP